MLFSQKHIISAFVGYPWPAADMGKINTRPNYPKDTFTGETKKNGTGWLSGVLYRRLPVPVFSEDIRFARCKTCEVISS